MKPKIYTESTVGSYKAVRRNQDCLLQLVAASLESQPLEGCYRPDSSNTLRGSLKSAGLLSSRGSPWNLQAASRLGTGMGELPCSKGSAEFLRRGYDTSRDELEISKPGY